MTNLSRLCQAFGWQGGTIHQASEHLIEAGLSRELCGVDNLLAMNSNAIGVIIALYKGRV